MNLNMYFSIRRRDAIRKNYADFLCDTMIRQNTTLSDATAHGISIFDYAPNSRAAMDINKLINEIINP